MVSIVLFCYLSSQWACALVKDGKHLYETEKYKRETFGKLFSKFQFLKVLFGEFFLFFFKQVSPLK